MVNFLKIYKEVYITLVVESVSKYRSKYSKSLDLVAMAKVSDVLDI